MTGIDVVKQDIARYITERDGIIDCDPYSICVTSGATTAIDVSFAYRKNTCSSKFYKYTEEI